MTIAQVIGTFSSGGAQRVPLDLASALAAMGHRSIGIAVREVRIDPAQRDPAVEFRELRVHKATAGAFVRAVLALRRVLQSSHADIVHVHGTGVLPLTVAAAKLCMPRPKLCFTWHDSGEVLERQGPRRHVLRFCIRQCHRVSGSSRSVADRLMRNAGLRRVDVFHGGVKVRPLPSERDRGAQQIAWVGTLCPNKDPETLVRCMAELRAGGVRTRCVVAGSPLPNTSAYATSTRALAADLNVADAVDFVGHLRRDEVDCLLGASTIGVQSSHSEGLSLALLEQMMAGLGVVATDVGDTSAAVVDGQTGLLIPPRDPEALRSALNRLLTDHDLRLRLARGARARVETHFSTEAMATRALAQYQELLDSRW